MGMNAANDDSPLAWPLEAALQLKRSNGMVERVIQKLLDEKHSLGDLQQLELAQKHFNKALKLFKKYAK